MRVHTCLRLLLLVLIWFSNQDSAYAGLPRTVAIEDFGNSLSWEPVRPLFRRVKTSSFTGKGVHVGVLELNYDLRQTPPNAHALSGVIQPQLVAQQETKNRSHLTAVTRILAGRNIGDAFGEGVAPDSRLYMQDDIKMLGGSLVFVQFSRSSAKIINNSWDWGKGNSIRYDEIYESEGAIGVKGKLGMFKQLFNRAVHDDGQLLIWAAGNARGPKASWPSLIPSVEPELEKGWLVVTSIYPNGTLRPPTNACGRAANWCLSSEQGEMADSRVGTSFAAPVVSGVAALVSEAYPWMDNHALRQTLLSTADSLGSPEMYGWGRVNADRAVRGPALFDSRLTFGKHFVADFDSHRADFYNDIGGDQGLVKKGTGILVLWGNNTYTGLTHVQDGYLELYGRVAGNVVVGEWGTLYSDGGTIGGKLINSNTVSIVGKGLRIQGDYKSNPDGSEVHAQLGTVLTVEGTARLDYTRWYILPPLPRYISKETEVLVQAGKIVGQFDEVVLFGMYEPKVVYTETRAEVAIQRNNIEAFAHESFKGQPTFSAAAAAVETAFTAIDESLQGLPVTVSEEFVAEAGVFQQIPSPTALATTLDSLTGEVYASSQAVSFQQAQLVNRALAHRVDALRQHGQDDGLWVGMLTANGKLQQRGYTGADTRLFGAQFGVDARLNHDTIVGAAFSWSDSNASFHRLGGRSQGRSRGLSLYGRYGAATGSYLSGRLGHDWMTTDVTRDIVIGTAKSISSTRHDGMTSVYAELGHVVASGQSTYTPYLGLEYNHLRRGAFKETGSTFALRASSATYEQGAVSFGMRYQSEPISWAGGEIILTSMGAYRYANPATLDFTAAFNGAPNATFRLQGINLARHSGWLGVGASTRLNSRHLQWYINLDVQLDHNGVDSHVVSAGMKYAFQ